MATYDEIEQGDGEPLELYKFTRGTVHYYLTNSATPYTYLGDIYQPEQIVRSKIDQTPDFHKANLDITLQREAAVVTPLINGLNSDVVFLNMFRTHRGASNVISAWKGRVVNIEMADSTAKLKCDPVFTSLKKIGLRALYQRPCRHALYDNNCKVNRAEFGVAGIVSGITGLTVNAAAFATKPDGWFVGGMLKVDSASRLIVGHTADNVVLLTSSLDIGVGSEFIVYPGCAHNSDACHNKFNNLDNCGCFEYIPIKDPFSGDAIA